MPKGFNVEDISPEFEKKIITIADEVLKILKELSLENKTKIKSEQIAEKMFWKDSLKNLLNDVQAITEDEKIGCDYRKEVANFLVDKFTEVIPVYRAKKLGEIKDALHSETLDSDSKKWMDSPLEVVKNYIDVISVRNNDLEDFLNKTIEHISSTEENMSKELFFQRQSINDYSEFENIIISNIDEIKQDISGPSDLNDVKAMILNRIENIHKHMELKHQLDIQHMKETEKTLDEMNTRMSEIKLEAHEIRRKSEGTEYKASHDALTGVYNRKAYEKKMDEILADVTRYDMTASLMICDIDYFMDINDKWGHRLGDIALIKLVAHIKNMMRTNDFISRYGGDMFAIILPHTGREGAHAAGERLWSYVDNAEFSYKGETVPLTVSIGISFFKKDDDTNAVFKRADNALCLAKQSGRNTVRTEEDTP